MLRELQETNAALQDVRELLRQQVRAGVGAGEGGERLGREEGGLGVLEVGECGEVGGGLEKGVLAEMERVQGYGKGRGKRGGPRDSGRG